MRGSPAWVSAATTEDHRPGEKRRCRRSSGARFRASTPSTGRTSRRLQGGAGGGVSAGDRRCALRPHHRRQRRPAGAQLHRRACGGAAERLAAQVQPRGRPDLCRGLRAGGYARRTYRLHRSLALRLLRHPAWYRAVGRFEALGGVLGTARAGDRAFSRPERPHAGRHRPLFRQAHVGPDALLRHACVRAGA